MLSRAQVNVAAPTGAKLPLLRHGAGTQSLSVLFLFEAFLNAGLGGADPNSTPILQLEEPEAHLHPAAARALWSSLAGIKGQKIFTTHSGDLLSEVPLESIRRLYRRAGDIHVGSLKQGTLTVDEARKIHYHVKRTRGELLFARCWLLVEGETEYWSFMGTASAAGLDLERAGIRVVEYTNVGAVPLTKLADDLGIWWHLVGDGDQAGQDVARTVRARLTGRPEADHISLLAENNMEVLLCKAGHVDIYASHIPQQNRAQVTAPVGTPQYCEQVASSLPKRAKTTCALEVYERLKSTPSPAIPQALTNILTSAKALADR
jgi:putative ATP-dependent endonuclease of OLD family